ncbi:iron-sulfur cluster assembly protein [Thermococcus stetteri]|uniref:iron-sulfur cluster assembly protein n=1 Tax=Thermococcus stetteri TaxID=49900 RepID=UPI001AE51146|nr:iron-sulfur cluster assembly protein [Thermococcus stetteri]MBP1912907.1 metal-sulfur cluster biosynthetic enzyme [Thermococcus stetteri]
MRIEEILELLKKVKNPFTNMDIVSEGLVSKIEIDEEGNKVTIYVAFARNTPAHPFAMAVNWPIQARIVKDIAKVLGDKVSYLEVVDDTTLQRYYPLDEDMEV